jgi:glycerophosphoryl diester phosphodiesterase
MLSALTGGLLFASGHTALTDEDILFFILSPVGLVVLLLAGAFYTTVVVFQQAAMITAAQHLTLGESISLSKLGHLLLMKSWPLFRLALLMIVRTVLLASPFIVSIAMVYQFFLTEFDINYYLNNRPAAFWWAGGLILLCLTGLTGLLLRIFSGWVLALPLLLLNNEAPSRVFQQSRKNSDSRRFSINVILVILFLINASMFAVMSNLNDLSLDIVVALAGNSLQALAWLLGSLFLAWFLANGAISFFANSTLSLVILYIFKRLVQTSSDGRPDAIKDPEETTRTWRISALGLTGLALILSIASGFLLNIKMNNLSLDDHTKIIAHRGASADAPENTLAAIELAIDQGADWVEIDVQETREGTVVVIHDSDLKKVAGSSQKVFELSLADLQSVDIGSWMAPSFSEQRIPSLQQVLELCKNRINIVIELKYYGQEVRLEERVAELVEAAGMQDQIAVMSLSHTGIQKMRTLRSSWKVGLLSSVAMGDITRLDVDFFAVNANFVRRRLIKQAHRRDRQVMVWTVNDPISMSAMMSKGVDGIITDKPGLAFKVRKERAELGVHERVMIQIASLIGKQPARPDQ